MSKSAIKAEQKLQMIVCAAESLFLNNGFGNTSMDQISAEAGVTKQTVYRYFPSKKDLFSAVMSHIQATESTPYQFKNASIEDELTGYGRYLLSFHLQGRSIGLYRLMITEGAREDLFKTFKNAGPKTVLQPLVEFLQAHYSLEDPMFMAQMLANMILAPRNQILMSAGSMMKKSAQNEHVEKVTKLFLKTLKA